MQNHSPKKSLLDFNASRTTVIMLVLVVLSLVVLLSPGVQRTLMSLVSPPPFIGPMPLPTPLPTPSRKVWPVAVSKEYNYGVQNYATSPRAWPVGQYIG